jgi:hypothetical protein
MTLLGFRSHIVEQGASYDRLPQPLFERSRGHIVGLSAGELFDSAIKEEMTKGLRG